MDILGIGPTELAFIILIALIILGPKDMQKTGRAIGRFLRNMTTSDGWRIFRDTSREIRNIPNRLMREANIEDLEKEVGKIGKEVDEIGKEIEEEADIKGFGTWTNPAAAKPKSSQAKPKTAEAPKEAVADPESNQAPDKETKKETEKEIAKETDEEKNTEKTKDTNKDA
jgi:sec-independent protein translocase protein TatB